MNCLMAEEIVVPESEQPKRLENFLKKRFPIGYIRKLFRKKAVRLNGRRTGPDDTAGPGDRISLFIPYEAQSTGEKALSRTGFEIVFEDDGLLIVNKDAGVAVHEGKGIPKRHSLAGMLEARYRPRGIVPKLVHRIDKETSGLLAVAKNEETAEALERSFKEGAVEKDYLALVVGGVHPKEGTIEFPLPGRDRKPVRALTRYRAERIFLTTSLLRVSTETGRMHQIRLHFAGIGHPLVMDDEHGDFSFNKQFRKVYGLKRQFLHASTLAFEHAGKKRKWSAPLPEDLARTLKLLETK